MPTELISALPELSFLVVFALLSLIEHFWPNQSYETNRAWFSRLFWLQLGGIALTALVGFVVTDAYKTMPLLPQASAVFRQIAPPLNGLIGYLLVTLINYWWHRLRHQHDLLWRTFHQVHHSTYRLQTATAFYSHPLDYAATVFIINALAYGVLGFDLQSAAWVTAWVGIFELWEHTNIRTPHWLGYVIVRPEMHRIHHELNKHRNNYGLPLWDMLFGTYENSNRAVVCGFSGNKESQLREMLWLKDVHKSSSG